MEAASQSGFPASQRISSLLRLPGFDDETLELYLNDFDNLTPSELEVLTAALASLENGELEALTAALTSHENGTMVVAFGGTRNEPPDREAQLPSAGEERDEPGEGEPKQRLSTGVATDGHPPATNDKEVDPSEGTKVGGMATSRQSFHMSPNGLVAGFHAERGVPSHLDPLAVDVNGAVPLQENITTGLDGGLVAAASPLRSDADLHHTIDAAIDNPFMEARTLPHTIPGQLRTTAATALDPSQAAPTLPLPPRNMPSDAVYAELASPILDSDLAPHPDIQAFAKLQFDDGNFLMNTYAVEIGRDIRAADRAYYRALMEQKELRKRRIKVNSSVGERPQSPNAFHVEDSARMLHSLVSNSGGIMGEDDYEFQLPNGDKNYQALVMRSLRDANDVAQRDISSLRPSPHECPIIPIHPPFGSNLNSISRSHIRIAYNFDKSLFEMTVIGRNGAFHDGNYYAPEQVEPLHNGSEIQIGGVYFRFFLPDAQADDAVAEYDEASQPKMSFEFENGRSESITMAGGSEEELDENVDVESSEDDDEDEGARLNDTETPDAGNDAEKVDEEQNDGGHVRGDKNDLELYAEGEDEEDEEEEEGEEEQSLPAVVTSIPHKVASKSKSQKSKPKSSRRKGRKPAVRKPAPPKTSYGKKPKPEPSGMQTKAQAGIDKEDSRTDSKAKNTDIKETTEHGTNPMKPEELSPTIAIPPRRKGPGRPPKNGFLSKREQNLIRQHQKEAERRVALGLPPPPELDLNKGKVTRPPKPSGDAGKGADGKDTPVRRKSTESQESSTQPPGDAENVGQQPSPPVEKPAKPVRQPRSPSPPMKESDYTDEQLVKPSQNYVYLISEAITNSKTGSLSLPQIYSAIEHAHPFFRFRASTNGWQSSVRHNLNQNAVFEKVSKEGKGYAWGVVEGAVIEKEKRKRVSPPPQSRPSHQPVPQQGPYAYPYTPQVSGAYRATGYPAYAGPYIQHAPVPQPARPNPGLPAPQPAGTAASTYSSPYGPLRQQSLQHPSQCLSQGRPLNDANGCASQPCQEPCPQAPPMVQSAPPQNRTSPSAQAPGHVPQGLLAPIPQSAPPYPPPGQTILDLASLAEIARFKQLFIDGAKGTSKNNNAAWIDRTFERAVLRISHPELVDKRPDATEKSIMKYIETLLRQKAKPQGEGQPASVTYGQPLPPHGVGVSTNGMSEVGQAQEGWHTSTPGPQPTMDGTSPVGQQQHRRSSFTPVPNNAVSFVPPGERGTSGQNSPMREPQGALLPQAYVHGNGRLVTGGHMDGSYLRYPTPPFPGLQTQQGVPAPNGVLNPPPSAIGPGATRLTHSRTPSASTPGNSRVPSRYQSPAVHTPPANANTFTQPSALQAMQANNNYRPTQPHLSLNTDLYGPSTVGHPANSPARPAFEALTPPPWPAADGPHINGNKEGMPSPKRKILAEEGAMDAGGGKRRFIEGL